MKSFLFALALVSASLLPETLEAGSRVFVSSGRAVAVVAAPRAAVVVARPRAAVVVAAPRRVRVVARPSVVVRQGLFATTVRVRR